MMQCKQDKTAKNYDTQLQNYRRHIDCIECDGIIRKINIDCDYFKICR